jgi:hypothetical protein
MRKLIVLLMAVTFLLGCSEPDSLTGKATLDAGTLLVTVQQENGTVIPDAKIYVNNIYKGTTSKFGRSKGSKTVVVTGNENVVVAEKEGYFPIEPLHIGTSPGNQQQVNIILERRKAAFLVEVKGDVEDAMVTLQEIDTTVTHNVRTDEFGIGLFDKVRDGNYSVTVRKQGYETLTMNTSFRYEEGDYVTTQVDLVELPKIEIKVVDEYNRALQGALVTIFAREDFNTPGAPPVGAGISEQPLTFWNVEYNETYVIVVKKQGFNAHIQYLNLKEENSKVKIVLEEE